MFTVSKDSSWHLFFEDEKSKPYFAVLLDSIDAEYESHICYPPKELIFNAFNSCNLNDLKVVIIGQDPYHGA
jgi:uracil-DNA glycosylase